MTQEDTKGSGNTKTSPKIRSRKWVITLNNYDTTDIGLLKSKWKNAKYVIGEEIGAQGTKH